MGKILAIAAVGPDGVMGKEGHLPWHYPDDLQHFDRSTRGHVAIMGYNTYLSLPRRMIDERTCLVLSKKHSINEPHVTTLSDVAYLHPFLQKTNFVIGGGAIFKLFFDRRLIDEAWITHIHKSYAGDTYFPTDQLTSWDQHLYRENEDFSIIYYKRCHGS